MTRGSVNLAEGPVGRHMINLGTFLALSVVSVLVMSLVDIYFVSRLGHQQLAALSFTFPVLMIVSAVNIGLGNGLMAIVARAVGEGNRDHIRTYATDAILLGFLLMMTMSTVGFLTIEPMFTLMGAGPEIMPYIKQYMHIWYMSAGVQVIPVLAQSIIRALGDTRTPSFMATAMCLITLVLDPILIFGWGPIPAFGIQGAAYANAAARFFSMVGMLSILHFRLHALAPLTASPARLRNSWTRVLHIGLPAMSAQLVAPISAAILTKVVALSGVYAVAAFGVATRIESTTSIYLWAVAGAMPPFVGQNAGAKRMDRVKVAVRYAVLFCLGAGVTFLAIMLIAGSSITSHFTDSPEVAGLATFYLQVVAAGYGLTGLVLIASQTMNALMRPLPAAAINLARTVVVTVPCALAGHWLGGIHGTFIGIAIGGATCGALALIVMTRIVREEIARAKSTD